MDNRYLGAAMLLPFIIFIFIGGIWLHYGIMILSILGMFEFYNVVKRKNIHTINSLGYLLCIIYFIFLTDKNYSNVLISIIILFLMMMLCITVIKLKYNFIDIAVTLLGFLYIPVFLGYIVLVNNKINGNYLVWLIFISSWLCDTAAYYTGRLFGKNKLCPEISPKKTKEGAIGGFLGSTIACGILGIIFHKLGVNIPIYNYFIIGSLCGVFCQFGDLVASAIKRFVGVKDYSHLIPGHGGILDRFDSILFASVIVYYYVTFILKV
jgi:phosphatidate cytidylyltransferase